MQLLRRHEILLTHYKNLRRAYGQSKEAQGVSCTMSTFARHSVRQAVALALCGTVCGSNALGAESANAPMTEVIVTAPYGSATPIQRVTTSVQIATEQDIARLHALDVTEVLSRSFAGVNINHAQNNPLQPDVNFRGFTASPLLGLPQGLSVYQNGVRINEPFGDTVNWDLLPLSAVSSIQVVGGANPVFGLNSLGGALSLKTKTGFDFSGTEVQLQGGSFGRMLGSLQYGTHAETFGFYGNVDYFEEDGWRDFSASEALRFLGVFSVRAGEDSALNVTVSAGETDLRGNGASPAELLAIDREQVFTHPDITENSQKSLIVDGRHRLSDTVVLAGNAHYRKIDTDTFNGDGTIFEECDYDGEELLVEEDFEDLNGDDECSSEEDANIALVLDPSGVPIEAELDDEQLDAINNIGRREQESYGASAQINWNGTINSLVNAFTFGVAFSEGSATFNSVTEVARLLDDRSTSRTGILADEFRTGVRSETSIASAYFANTLSLNDRSGVTLSGRFDRSHIRLNDRTGETPELNGSHRFQRFNPAVGMTFDVNDATTLFANIGESTRTPTPIELACASEDAPCNLPNAFLADPPLEQVVARTAELGLRSQSADGLKWTVSAFHSTNRDDILFQTTGGAQANVGFFDNVGDTQRAGLELGLSKDLHRLHWYFEYSFVDATFEDEFVVNSPNHPVFEEDEDAEQIVGEGALLVESGSTIPGIPEHQANFGADFSFTERFSIGADVNYRSGVYLRGDEANLTGKTDSYAIVNLRSEFRLADYMTVFARIENVFDEQYETFGLLGEPDEVFPQFEDARFFGSGPPRGAWVGLRMKF